MENKIKRLTEYATNVQKSINKLEAERVSEESVSAKEILRMQIHHLEGYLSGIEHTITILKEDD